MPSTTGVGVAGSQALLDWFCATAAQTAATVATTAMAVSTTLSNRRSAVTISLSPCPGREPSPVRPKSVHPQDDGESFYGTRVGPGEGRGGGPGVRTVLAWILSCSSPM